MKQIIKEYAILCSEFPPELDDLVKAIKERNAGIWGNVFDREAHE